jgi:hypothetical protein
MRVQWATLARHAEAETLQLRYPEAEAGHEYLAAFTVRDPDLQPIGRSLEVRFAPALTPLHAPGWEAFFSIASALSFTVDEAGRYSTGIDVDGAHAVEIPFRIADVG